MLYTHVGRWPVGADPHDFKTKGCSVRNQKYRFVNDTALFDMEQDPGQTTNVADRHPDIVARFRAAYDEWWKGTVPLMVNEGTPLSKTRPFHELFRKQSETTGIPDWKPPKI
jgi:arylsulfatase